MACGSSNVSSKRRFLAQNLPHAKAGDPMMSVVAGSYTPCCKDNDDFQTHFGERVALTGVYNRTVVSRIPNLVPEPNTSGAVQLKLDNSAGWVMLGIYYEANGQRSVEEVKQFEGKRVTAYGHLHRNTPEQVSDGMVMQTMISPYMTVSRIELAP
jgi:hypothetical protein